MFIINMDGLCNTSWDGSGTDRLTIAHDGSMVVHGNLDCASLITARRNTFIIIYFIVVVLTMVQ